MILKELNNLVHLQIENKGQKIFYVGERSKVEDDFDIDTPFKEDMLADWIKDRHKYDSVKRISSEQFEIELKKIKDSNENVIVI